MKGTQGDDYDSPPPVLPLLAAGCPEVPGVKGCRRTGLNTPGLADLLSAGYCRMGAHRTS